MLPPTSRPCRYPASSGGKTLPFSTENVPTTCSHRRMKDIDDLILYPKPIHANKILENSVEPTAACQAKRSIHTCLPQRQVPGRGTLAPLASDEMLPWMVELSEKMCSAVAKRQGSDPRFNPTFFGRFTYPLYTVVSSLVRQPLLRLSYSVFSTSKAPYLSRLFCFLDHPLTHAALLYQLQIGTCRGCLPATEQGHCHLPLSRLRPALLQLLTFNTPWGSPGWRMRPSVLQGIWWDRSLDSYIFLGADFLIPNLQSLHI